MTDAPSPDPIAAILDLLASALAERLRPLLAGGSIPTPAGAALFS